jgi:succinate dehydrogenase/fumarate reductase flavoprotein subunit
MITTFLLFFFTYLVGYVAGYYASKEVGERVLEASQAVREGVKKLLPDNRIKPGIIKRPTAKDLEERNTPQHIKEGREEMKKVLDTIPELQEQKALLKRLREEQP